MSLENRLFTCDFPVCGGVRFAPPGGSRSRSHSGPVVLCVALAQGLPKGFPGMARSGVLRAVHQVEGEQRVRCRFVQVHHRSSPSRDEGPRAFDRVRPSGGDRGRVGNADVRALCGPGWRTGGRAGYRFGSGGDAVGLCGHHGFVRRGRRFLGGHHRGQGAADQEGGHPRRSQQPWRFRRFGQRLGRRQRRARQRGARYAGSAGFGGHQGPGQAQRFPGGDPGRHP